MDNVLKNLQIVRKRLADWIDLQNILKYGMLKRKRGADGYAEKKRQKYQRAHHFRRVETVL